MTVRILHLEDDPLDTELVAFELRKAGLDFELRRVDTREQFLASLRGWGPDVIISDHNVPVFDGRAALDLTLTLAPDTPFILCTGSLNEETAVNYMKIGAADYVLKDHITRLGPSVIDALDRAVVRRRLRSYESLLRAILDAAPSLIFVRDGEGRFIMVNRALAEAYGTTAEALMGRTLAEVNPDGEARSRALAVDREVMSTRQPLLRPEEPIDNPVTGERRWFQMITVPLTVPGDDAPKVLGVATDITQRKVLEDQLRQSQKIEAVGQLAGGVAHDFNNLLTVILGHAELLLRALPSGSDYRPDVEEVRAAAARARTLTGQLLAFSRRQVLQPRVVQLNDLVAGMEKMLRRLISEDITIRLDLDPHLGLVRADPGQLEQVVMNLALNARDAMPAGGRLLLQTRNVLPGTGPDALSGSPHIALVVADTGRGMPPEIRVRAFEPFFTTKGPGQGTGLGLSTVYGIVKQSGGEVTVDSEPERGTTFRVLLPREEGALPEVSDPVPPPRDQPRGRETILLVEDAEGVRSLAERILRGAGYTVLSAADVIAAERAAAGYPEPIHLLLTDVILPGISGRDLARRLSAARPETRVLFMSGYPDDPAIAASGPAGSGYLEKPFTADSLTRKVREVLSGTDSAAR